MMETQRLTRLLLFFQKTKKQATTTTNAKECKINKKFIVIAFSKI
jgi:hypothetical protein